MAADLRLHAEAIKAQAAKYGEQVYLVKGSSDAWTAILSSRDAFGADEAAWKDLFVPAVDALKVAHDEVVKRLAQGIDWREPPRLVTEAAAFLKPTTLAIGEPSQRVTRAGELTMALVALPPLLERVQTIAHRLRVLGDERNAHSREGSERLTAALALFDEAWWVIRTARSASDLDVTKTTAQLDRASDLLDDVMARIRLTVEPEHAELVQRNLIGPSSSDIFAATREALDKLLDKLPALPSTAALTPLIGTGLGACQRSPGTSGGFKTMC